MSQIISVDSGQQFATGWYYDPAEVKASVMRMAAVQSSPIVFGDTPLAAEADDNKTVTLWSWELALFNALKASWNQKQVGSCVSFGWGRAINDLIGYLAAMGEIDWPGFDVATEPIYGGSRVEVGGGRIRGDGSVGSWAAEWVSAAAGKGGVLLRKVYGSIDLSTYNEQRCREYGSRGCPDELEPEARLYPVKNVVAVTNANDAWKLLGSNYPIPVCSNRGFTTTLREGFCSPSGTWNHCMELRARVVAKQGSGVKKAFAIQNSWDDYLQGDPFFIDGNTGEKVKLPPGCFLADFDVVNDMLSQGDSFSVSGQQGFKKREPFRFIV